MKIPADGGLSNAEIVRFVDLAAADIPGWVPSEHIDDDSLIRAYREARAGDPEHLELLTTNRFLALLVMVGQELIETYEQTGRPFAEAVEETCGPGTKEALTNFLKMRAYILAEQVADWDDPAKQLALYQSDSFLMGWLAHHRYTKKDDA